jgi:hypothetical protein
LTLKMSKTLRFWLECECRGRREASPVKSGSEINSEILHEYEVSGDAMRYLNAKGQLAWKASPSMLQRLADAEHEAKADMEDWP